MLSQIDSSIELKLKGVTMSVSKQKSKLIHAKFGSDLSNVTEQQVLDFLADLTQHEFFV